jgi:hypothetical protein
MNGVMELASEVRRTLCNAISLCGYSYFPRWVSRQHLLPIGRVIETNLTGAGALGSRMTSLKTKCIKCV